MKRPILVVVVMLTVGCACWLGWKRFAERRNFRPGEIYSVADGKGFRVVKVLDADTQAVHLRVYKNVYASRPRQIDESKLTLGTINDADGFGIGHLPLSREKFVAWNPVFVMRTSVSKEELEGYEIWKQSGGGLWETPW